MKPFTLRIGLAVALALTLAATWYAPADDAGQPVAATPRRVAKAAGAAAGGAFVDVLPIRDRALADDDDAPEARLFNTTEWTAAAPAANAAQVVAAPEPAAPQAPALPFKVLGTHEQAGQTVVFLQQNDTNHVVRVGDTIAATYKVESLEGATLTLRYLPMNQVQTLDLGRTLSEKREPQ